MIYLDGYFNGVFNKPNPNLDIKLTDTLKGISKLKSGQVKYYSDVMGKKYARSVGNSCKNNPILIIIPCHRIIIKSGKVLYVGKTDNKK